MFRNKTDGEFTFVQKLNFTQEEFEKLLAMGKTILQALGAKVTNSPKRLVLEEDSEQPNKENIDPVHKYGESNV